MIRDIVEHIDSLLEKLSPYAGIIGADKIVAMITSAVEVAEVLIENVNNTQEVLSSSEMTFVLAKLDEIKSKNDKLNEQVRNS